jgi:hypothetical protein
LIFWDLFCSPRVNRDNSALKNCCAELHGELWRPNDQLLSVTLVDYLKRRLRRSRWTPHRRRPTKRSVCRRVRELLWEGSRRDRTSRSSINPTGTDRAEGRGRCGHAQAHTICKARQTPHILNLNESYTNAERQIVAGRHMTTSMPWRWPRHATHALAAKAPPAGCMHK